MQEQRALTKREALLVDFLERNAEGLTRNWLRIVRNHQLTRSYGAFDEDKVFARAFRMFEQLRLWVAQEFSKSDISSYYAALGAQRRREGFALPEVVRALIVARRVLWFGLQEDGFVNHEFTAELALDLNNRVIQFFDQAVYHATVGYTQK
jgi:hypothetical protein